MKGIYKITSPSGSIYIGQSIDLDRRKLDYSKIRCKGQPAIHNSIKKYGWENHIFEIIDILPEDVPAKILTDLEQAAMDLYKEAGFKLLNLRGADLTCGFSDEMRAKMSNSAKLRILSKEGRNRIKETRIKKAICQYSEDGILIKCFESIAEASRQTKINLSGMYQAASEKTYQRGKIKLAGGFRWKFKQNI